MSKFRKIVEDIRAELLNVDDAIKANEFANQIIPQFLEQVNIFIQKNLFNEQIYLTITVSNIVIEVIPTMLKHNINSYDTVTKKIYLRLETLYALLEIDTISQLLHHELIHYYDDVIALKGLKKTYGSPEDVLHNYKAYATSDVEVSAVYPTVCAYIENMLKNAKAAAPDLYNMSKEFDLLYSNIFEDTKYPQYSLLHEYNLFDRKILYNAVKKYILKVME